MNPREAQEMEAFIVRNVIDEEDICQIHKINGIATTKHNFIPSGRLHKVTFLQSSIYDNDNDDDNNGDTDNSNSNCNNNKTTAFEELGGSKILEKILTAMKKTDKNNWNFLEQVQQTKIQDASRVDLNDDINDINNDDCEQKNWNNNENDDDSNINNCGNNNNNNNNGDNNIVCTENVQSDIDNGNINNMNNINKYGINPLNVNIRVIEYHSYCKFGGLMQKYHFDGGSIITAVIMLSNPKKDFIGGNLMTWEKNETFKIYDSINKGDMLIFPSNKYHCVSQITQGERYVFVIELWENLHGNQFDKNRRPGSFGYLIEDSMTSSM